MIKTLTEIQKHYNMRKNQIAHHSYADDTQIYKVQGSRFQGFFICHIIVIQGITRSEMQSNQVAFQALSPNYYSPIDSLCQYID